MSGNDNSQSRLKLTAQKLLTKVVVRAYQVKQSLSRRRGDEHYNSG